MYEKEKARPFVIKGGYFQFPMIFVWLGRGLLYNTGSSGLPNPATFSGAAFLIGAVIMAWSMRRIYRPINERKLITSDIFALTRHPMYHGMFIADAGAFFEADLTSPLFWCSWLVFVFLLCMAGWFQEKETLAAFGDEAKAYYARTPRFIFGWLLP